MAKEMRVSEIEEFLDGPLVTWFSSCLDPSSNAEKLTYEEVIDGVLIHHVFLQMDLHCLESDIIPPASDASLRARNLKKILGNIRLFYEEELNHAVIRLPDVSRLSREPHLHVSEAQLLLKLLLGCAVNCPRKEYFIENIKKLEEKPKTAIAEYIRQDLQAPGIMLSQEMLESLMDDTSSVTKIFEIVRNLCRVRDYYKIKVKNMTRNGVNKDAIVLNRTMQMSLEENELEALNCSEVQNILNSSIRSDREESQRKDAELLAEMRNKLRKQQEELIKRDEDLREARCEIINVQNEKKKLVSELKSAKQYRDELDAANERAQRADRLEQEIVRYKEKLAKVDSYKSSLKELREKYRLLAENKKSLHEQLDTYKQKASQVTELKQQIFQLKKQIQEENAISRKKYRELCEENAQLEQLVKASTKETMENGFSIGSYNTSPIDMDNSLFEEMNNSAQSQSLKLELENRRLSNLLDSIKEKSIHEESTKLVDVQKENKSLREQIRKLDRKYCELEKMYQLAHGEKQKLKAEKEILLKSKEKLTSELDHLKTVHDQLNVDFQQLLQDKNQLETHLTEDEESIKNLETRIKVLEEECAYLKSDNNQVEHAELKEDFSRLFKANEKLCRDYKRVMMELKKRDSEESELRNKSQRIVELDIELNKMQQVNSALEKNNHSIMKYNTELLKQVHQLIMQAHEDRENYFKEERKNTDQVNNLKRQKEKLEEKIMDQYRKQESTSAKKKKSSRSLVKDTFARVSRASSEFFLNRSRRSLAEVSCLADEPSFDFEFTRGYETRLTGRESSFSTYAGNYPRNRKSIDFLENFEPSDFSFGVPQASANKTIDFAELCSLYKHENEEDLDKTLSIHEANNTERIMERIQENEKDELMNSSSKQAIWMDQGCA